MILNPHLLLTHSLRENPWGDKAARIMAASLAAVAPSRVINANLARSGNLLKIMGNAINLGDYARVFLMGIGKASLAMTVSVGDLIYNELTEGSLLIKKGRHELPERFQSRIEIYTGSHPVPDEDSYQATGKILSQFSSLEASDLVIVLISGGGSALFSYPAKGISIVDLKKTSQALLACGANIREINTIRKHLSFVKGGGLARLLQPARVFALILSDVMGDPVDMIASGLTAPDPTTYSDALQIVNKYNLAEALPKAVLTHLDQGRQGALPETPKPGDPLFQNVTNLILAGNRDALQAGAEQSQVEGLTAHILPEPLSGEAKKAGKNLAHQLLRLTRAELPFPKPALLIAGGETTVSLKNVAKPGLGGRNLETALSALPFLDGIKNAALITLATDGEDGVTDAAGAVVTGKSYQRCLHYGLDPEDQLRKHDSYPLFQTLDDLLLPGPTGTNVNDLCFLFAF